MSLINNLNKSTAQKQLEAVAAIQNQIKTIYRQMLTIYTSAMHTVWTNPDGLTPQQVIDGFGSQATELFQLAGLLAYTINAVQADTVAGAPAGYEITYNADGTVSIDELSSASSASSDSSSSFSSESSEEVTSESSSSSVEI